MEEPVEASSGTEERSSSQEPSESAAPVETKRPTDPSEISLFDDKPPPKADPFEDARPPPEAFGEEMAQTPVEEDTLEPEGQGESIRWRKVVNTQGPSPEPRHGHRAIAIRDLMIVYGGGNEGLIDELHVYNTTTNQWLVPSIRGDLPPGCAVFGMVAVGTHVYVFGGITDTHNLCNDLYELSTARWEWRKLRPRVVAPKPPCGRLGHSFTVDSNQIIYMFGGLTHGDPQTSYDFPTEKFPPSYLNDFYTLDLKTLSWDMPQTFGKTPTPRESHSAVVHEDGSSRKLIVFGGMNTYRLGDLWILDLDSMTWSEVSVDGGIPPLPRSLHTANVVNDRMYIFGGWVPININNDAVHDNDHFQRAWKCTNTIGVYNIKSNSWEYPYVFDAKNEVPRARAGHCAVVINKRVWIWSGRDGLRKTYNNQVCCRDMWFLESQLPETPSKVHLVKAQMKSLDLSWSPVPNAEAYFLQIQKLEVDKQGGYVVAGTSIRVNDRNANKGASRVAAGADHHKPPGQEVKTVLISKEASGNGQSSRVVYLQGGQTKSVGHQDADSSLPHNLLDGQDEVQEAAKAIEGHNTDTGASHETSEPSQIQSTSIPSPSAEEQQRLVELEMIEKRWCDVGIIRGTAYSVQRFIKPGKSRLDHFTGGSRQTVQEGTPMIPLIPATSYRFRIAGLNSLGRGEWSDVALYRTCSPGFPGAPSSIRINKSQEGASVSWEPPQACIGRIIEYSVYLAVRNSENTLAFMRVYVGAENRCTVPRQILDNAHIDPSGKPAIVFRIAAKNEKGYGPATQVRWLQEQHRDVRPPHALGAPVVIRRSVVGPNVPIPPKRPHLDDQQTM